MNTTTTRASSFLLLALAGCSEFNLGNHNDDVPPGTCPLDIPLPMPVETDMTCGVIPTVTAPWDVQERWSYWGAGEFQQMSSSFAPPLVARLADSDGDGDVDEDDHPNIAIIAFDHNSGLGEGKLVVLDGVTHEEVWTWDGPYWGGGHALGDANGDGRADVVTMDLSLRVALLDGKDGSMIWRTSETVDRNTAAFTGNFPQATIADLDGDGSPEIVAHNLILDGATGDKLGELIVRQGIPYTMPAIGDIDLDGKQEILFGNTLHAYDGTPLWTTSLAGDYGHFAAIVNADEDPEGEFMMVGGYRFKLFDTDGTEIESLDLPRRAASAPCVADFDGDGASEVAFGLTNGGSSSPALFQARRLDGTLMWEREVIDASGIAGCTAYDVDGDGAYEILYADEEEIFIFDGASGTPLYFSNEHASGTVYEYPVVADVDMDGHAEMLIVRSGSDALPLLTVRGSDWAPAGEVWPLHDFAVTNIEPDGGIPQAPPLYWVEHNTYRARPVIDESPVDFQVDVVDVCSESCNVESEVRIGVQVVNVGPMTVPGGVGVTLYSSGLAGVSTVETKTLGTMLPGRVVNVTFEVPLSAIGNGEVLVRVDDIGTGAGFWPECNEENNEDRWGPIECGAH